MTAIHRPVDDRDAPPKRKPLTIADAVQALGTEDVAAAFRDIRAGREANHNNEGSTR